MSNFRWTRPGTAITPISSVSIDAGDNKLGSEVKNFSGLHPHVTAELVWTVATSATAQEVIELFFLYSMDEGTNFEDGGDSVDPFKLPVGRFIDDGGATAQRQIIEGIQIEPFSFKPLLKSELTDDATLVTLSLSQYRLQQP
jgi:hypothetical protein